MTQTQVDNKGRVLIPKELRENLGIENNEKINIFAKDKCQIVIEKVSAKKRKDDPLDWLLRNPAHIDPKLATKEKLDEIEEEMWKP